VIAASGGRRVEGVLLWRIALLFSDVDVILPNTPDSVLMLGIDVVELVLHCVGRWKLEAYARVRYPLHPDIFVCRGLRGFVWCGDNSPRMGCRVWSRVCEGIRWVGVG
jgi:hypothetical protein